MVNDEGAEPRGARPYRWLVALAYLVAVFVGLKYGYDVGKQIAGSLIGVVMALNTALFASFVVAMVVERLDRLKRHKDGAADTG